MSRPLIRRRAAAADRGRVSRVRSSRSGGVDRPDSGRDGQRGVRSRTADPARGERHREPRGESRRGTEIARTESEGRLHSRDRDIENALPGVAEDTRNLLVRHEAVDLDTLSLLQLDLMSQQWARSDAKLEAWRDTLDERSNDLSLCGPGSARDARAVGNDLRQRRILGRTRRTSRPGTVGAELDRGRRYAHQPSVSAQYSRWSGDSRNCARR